MKNKSILYALCILLLLCMMSFQRAEAVTAYPGPILYHQPDGTTLTLLLRGDESIHWAMTPDGYTLLSRPSGAYEYATINSKGRMICSGVVAHDPDQRTNKESDFLSKTEKKLFFSSPQLQEMKKPLLNAPRTGGFPTIGTKKLLVIMANFSNTTTTYTQTDFDQLMNQPNYDGTGSFRDYYLEVSYGKLIVNSTVTAWVTLPHPHDYYVNSYDLAMDAIAAADTQLGINMADFDNDGDGIVEDVAIFHQGTGSETSGNPTDIHSQSWNLSYFFPEAQRTFDGVAVDSYTVQPEILSLDGKITTIGVMCHEFGHSLGAPDFYDTNGTTDGQYDGTGYWDIMASGNWGSVNRMGDKPLHHNAYTKSYIFGWFTPTILTSSQTRVLPEAEYYTSAVRYNTTTSNEFFLCENRQKIGFDAALPGHGLIIYHVDGNAVSASFGINTGSHQGFYPVCASATGNPPDVYGTINSPGCPFPGTGNKTAFSDATTPNSHSWAGATTGYPLTSITENAYSHDISFCFNGCTAVNDPPTFTATPSGTSQVNLAWTLYSGNSVMIAYSTSSSFVGEPVSGTSYANGVTLPGGGTVIYKGTATSYNHPGLNPGTTYYYKAWSILTSNTYSPGISANATTTCAAVNTLPFTENFSAYAIPNCWTSRDNQGNGEVWQFGVKPYNAIGQSPSLSGTYAYLDSRGYGSGNSQNADLITPTLNLSTYISVTLSFNHYLRTMAGAGTISYSTDDGSTWTVIQTFNTTSALNPVSFSQMISAADLHPQVKFKWNYTGTYDLWWGIDDINITGVSVNTPPTVTTSSITSVTTTTAGSGGIVTNQGGTAVTSRGVCWSTLTNPTVTAAHTTDGTGTGAFSSSITPLIANMIYHVRAYATNAGGTSYGDDVPFPTLIDPATINITPASSITSSSATSGGTITATGNGAIIARGICWSTVSSPTLANLHTSDGSGTGSFVSSMTGLASNTWYYIRAYATNSSGTSYTTGSTPFMTLTGPPNVTTTTPTAITTTTATSGGNVISTGGATVTARGVCWATTVNPTTLNTKTTDTPGTGTYNSSLTGLVSHTTYHVRAYATNSNGTNYGGDISFRTAIGPPTVTTTAISSITSSSAVSGGNVTSSGDTVVTSRGVCWSVSANPTISDTHTTNGTGTGSFTSTISGLYPTWSYHVRAYATNSAGTSYGSDVQFTTPIAVPTLSTIAPTTVTYNTANPGGYISSNGGGDVTVRGICWSTTHNPDLSSLHTNEGTGNTTFYSTLTGLSSKTTYYARAYATNSAGTAYGSEAAFTTSKAPPVLTTTDASNIGVYTATSGGNITWGGDTIVTARGVCWGTDANPTIYISNYFPTGSGTGSFTTNMNFAQSNHLYHIRAYATSAAGTSYGNDVQFTTLPAPPTVTTYGTVTNITATTASSGGNVSSSGDAPVTAKGVCWASHVSPSLNDYYSNDGTGLGTFTSTLTGLHPYTTYYVVAYATNIGGTFYNYLGGVSFTTAGSYPDITTTTASSITATTASAGGNVAASNGSPVTAKGVCWSTAASPTISGTHTSDGSGTGVFTSSISGLSVSTTYHLRAYATNGFGTSYGSDIPFTTTIVLPTVTTITPASITLSTASSGGNVTSAGGGTITARGVCWATIANPVATGIHTTDGSGTGIFTSSITSLVSNTTYHVRAYATNSAGTSYGSDLSFTTLVNPPIVTTTAASVITATTASSGGNVTAQGDAPVTARGVCWSTLSSPDINASHTTNGTGTGVFTSTLTSLSPNTLYHVRAYATNTGGTSYGSDSPFTTLVDVPVVTTTTPTSIAYTSCSAGGIVTSAGGGTVTARGVCWSTAVNPVVTGSHTSDGTGTGTFTSAVTSLSSNTTYHLRAYATNSTATAYGSDLVFSTPILPPTVTTTAPSAITVTTASSGGNVTAKGDAPVTARGVCWATTSNPTINSSSTTDGTGTGTFTSSLTGLASNTTYHLRAYATNSGGTSYGSDNQFTTSSYTLSVSPSNSNIPYQASASYFTVTSNTSWTVQSDQSWCTVPANGTGNLTMPAYSSINTTFVSRVAHITLTVPGIAPVVVTVTQDAAPVPDFYFTMANDVQTSDRTYEFDLYLKNANSATSFELASISAGIFLNNGIAGTGTLSVSIIPGSSQLVVGQQPTTVTLTDEVFDSYIRLSAMALPGAGYGTIIGTTGAGTKICRLRITNSVAFAQGRPNLSFAINYFLAPTKVYRYVSGTSTLLNSNVIDCYSNCTNPVLNWTSTTVNLSLYSEGLYAGGGTMNTSNDENGAHFGSSIADQITVELHSSSNYSTIIQTINNVDLFTSGIATFTIPSSLNGNYYITVKQRNSITTVSANPVSFNDNVVYYNFSTGSDKAFANNEIMMIDGFYAIFSGDTNLDDIVDSSDMMGIDNLSTASASGYLPEDVNGDGLVDSSDMGIVDNNSTNSISAATP